MNLKRSAALFGGGLLTARAYRAVKSVAKQNSPLRRYWEHQLIHALDDLESRAPENERPLIYVAFGDSAAQGLGADEVGEGYVPRIAMGLEHATGREVVLLNLSLSGGTVASVLGTQLPQLNGLELHGKPLVPDVVTLDIGGNDVGLDWLDLSEFRARYRQLCEQLPAGTFIADIPTFKPLRVATRAQEMSAIIREEASKRHHVVELEALSESLSLRDYMVKYHAPDLFHPNSPWYELWAQEFLNKMSEVRGWQHVNVGDLPRWSANPSWSENSARAR